MKISKLFSASLLVAALTFAACDTPPVVPPGPVNPDPDTTKVEPVDATEISVADLLAVIEGLAPGAESTEYYQISGTVGGVSTSAKDMLKYGNLNFTLADETGSITCFKTNYLDNKTFTTADQMLEIGDTVTVVGKAYNYLNSKNNKTTPELSGGYLTELKRNQYVPEIIDATFAEAVTTGKGQVKDVLTKDKYRITGVISAVKTTDVVKYKNCDFNIVDPANPASDPIVCYRTQWLDNADFTDAKDIPVVGDTVTVVGPLTNYNDDAELYKGYIESITRYIAPPIVVDDDSNLDVPEGTITCARALEIGAALNANDTTPERYFIKGIVLSMTSSATDIKAYGNVIFTMADAVDATEVFTAYCVFGKDSTMLLEAAQVMPGNVVVVKAPIMKYVSADGSTTAIESPKNLGYIYSTTNTYVPTVVPEELPDGTKQDLDFAGNVLNVSGEYQEVADSLVSTVGDLKLIIRKGSSSNNVRIYPTMYRMYKNSNFTIAAPEGKNIKYIKIISSSNNPADNIKADAETLSVEKNLAIWNGEANAVTFNNEGKAAYISKITVIYD